MSGFFCSPHKFILLNFFSSKQRILFEYLIFLYSLTFNSGNKTIKLFNILMNEKKIHKK
jgi:hypothetical protein